MPNSLVCNATSKFVILNKKIIIIIKIKIIIIIIIIIIISTLFYTPKNKSAGFKKTAGI